METVDRLITSRREFHDAVEWAIAKIAEHGCPEVFISDDDFHEWPLGGSGLVDTLKAWALPHRQFHVLARGYSGLPQRFPRWVEWRRRWSHVVHCRSVAHLEPGKCPSLVIAPGLLGLRLSDPVHFRGRLFSSAPETRVLKDQFDALSQQSEEAFPASTLGL